MSGPGIIVCGQDQILSDECVACGGWLSRLHRSGYEGPHGWRFCSLECIDDQVEHEAQLEIRRHLAVRDLLCSCEVCEENGLPTQAMLNEYAAYLVARSLS